MQNIFNSFVLFKPAIILLISITITETRYKSKLVKENPKATPVARVLFPPGLSSPIPHTDRGRVFLFTGTNFAGGYCRRLLKKMNMSWNDYFIILQNVSTRYFFIAGIAFLTGYVLFRRWLKHKKIQQRFPEAKHYLREIGYSIITMLLFAFIPLLLIKNPAIEPFTTHYKKIEEYGWFYFYAAFPLMFIIHDTYFYWTHRFMHHPKVFRIFHLVHHQSTNPSPWAAYAFHPLEGIVEVGIVAVFLFTIPIHSLHLPIFFLLSIIYNVYGHTGYEIYPKGFSRNWLGKWINTSVNHNLHHQYFKGNYGLYFLFWDRMMGTIRSDYDERFEEVKGRTKLEPAINRENE